MTPTLTRRIEQMERSFGPTEAAARWLVEAKGYGSMAAYQAAFTTGEVAIPLVELPRLVTAWVKRNSQGETERNITQKTARAVRAVMTRVCLVDWMNSQIDWEKHADEFALESFRDLAPCVLAARADAERRARWLALILRRSLRSQRRPHRIARDLQRPGDRLDRQPLRSMQPADLSPVLHSQQLPSPLGS